MKKIYYTSFILVLFLKINLSSAQVSLDSIILTTDFMLASISKIITATAIMNVSEKGGFQLHDNINKYLPLSVVNPIILMIQSLL